jgi:hypothetical protein
MKLLMTLLCILPLSFLHAEKINEIDSLAAAYDYRIAAMEAEEEPFLVPHITTSSYLMKRAIGGVQHDITIYFDIVQSEEPSANIRKVSFTLKSGSYNIQYSYYFDLEGGLIYYHEKDENAYYDCQEWRLYFEGSQCLQLMKNPIKTNGCEGSSITTQKTTQFNDKEQEKIKMIQVEAQQFAKLLALHYALMTKID